MQLDHHLDEAVLICRSRPDLPACETLRKKYKVDFLKGLQDNTFEKHFIPLLFPDRDYFLLESYWKNPLEDFLGEYPVLKAESLFEKDFRNELANLLHELSFLRTNQPKQSFLLLVNASALTNNSNILEDLHLSKNLICDNSDLPWRNTLSKLFRSRPGFTNNFPSTIQTLVQEIRKGERSLDQICKFPQD